MFVAGNVNESSVSPPAPSVSAKKPRRKAKQKKVCPCCHECFTPASGNQKFCTKMCRKEYRFAQPKTPRAESGKNRRRKNVKQAAVKRRKRKIVCLTCRTKFIPTCPEQKYCTPKCRTKAKRCRTRTAREKTLLDMYAGFDGRCYLCGFTIPLDVPPEHPLLLTRDHIVPKTVGGSTSANNLAPAHKLCNNVKGGMSVQDFHATKKQAMRVTIARLLLQFFNSSPTVAETSV